ncbi:uncharacterized protein LOC132722802 [Ruditapes philippinarum]|uniref:uncharacterized protein LOC132722802 n=1 Tax=Ruditapes philippinarum TaxID=129788 RepID=UPI00295BBCE1|nr:uncharacterized protein LOC132722802 [Ruditapes philippinarum]
MQNIRAASEITFGTNLNEQAIHVIEFLKTVNDIPELNKSSTLKRAVYRYEKYWLPLAAEYPNEFLAPPLDVEWAWHCHMLNPNAYERDCREIVGSTVKHTMLGARRFYKEQRKSQRYWLEKIGKYQEPFTIDYREPFDTVAIDTYHSKITYDILAASKRQMDLYYQVSLPHYKNRKYLNTSHLRYKQFLYAKAKLPNAFLEPSYDIDLFWHAHQLNPVIYKEDVTRIVGYFLNHGASIDHRTEEDRLNADKQSRDTWLSLYNETMPIFGAMYRGSQPAGLLYKTEKTEYCQSFMQRTKLVFDNVTISMPRIRRAVTLSLWSLADKTRAEHVFSLEYQTISRLQNTTMKWKNVGQYVFETSTDCKMLIMLEAPVGLGLKTVMASNVVNLLPWLENSRNLGNDRHIDVPVSLGHNIRLDLTISIKQLGFDQAMLTLEPGKYRPSSIPRHHKQFLGPIGLQQYPRGSDNYCEVASHRLRNHLGNDVFHVRSIHSRPLMMSVIQVFYQNKMSAIAHIIGSDHLPLPSQVDKDEITLNPLQGERAILLKNNGGDWVL